MRTEHAADANGVRRASTMSGMPSRRASFIRCLKHSRPIRPLPMLSWRSFLLPSGRLHARRSQRRSRVRRAASTSADTLGAGRTWSR